MRQQMKKQSYQKTISADVSAEEAFQKISKVNKWWSASFKGSAEKLNDVFSVNFGETYVNFKLIEVVPNKKVVWLVTDCNLHWINNKTEWKGTKVVFELSPQSKKTKVTMTHAGLVPEVECYKDCKVGWDFYIEKSLFKLLTEERGLPDQG
jgi:Activator of Hsp90 ATPase homolog 1-like protein